MYYRRYIDDLLMIWYGTEEEALSFVSLLNENSVGIKFTSEFNKTSINYLDVTLTGMNNSHVSSRVYRKPITGNTLLHAKSNHPKRVFKSVLKGQFIRLRRNCTTDKEYETQSLELEERFCERGYKRDLVSHHRLNIGANPRNIYLENKIKDRTNEFEGVSFITQYSNQFHQICNIVRKHFNILKADDGLVDTVSKGCRYAFRRGVNLSNILAPTQLRVRDEVGSSWMTFKGTYKCNFSQCTACEFLQQGEGFRSCVTGENFRHFSCLNCRTRFAIYLLTCIECNIQYTGLTTRETRERIREHISNIKNGKLTTPLVQHFKICHQTSIKSFRWTIIEQVKTNKRGGDRERLLEKREVFWIHRLRTRVPEGLNSEFDLINFWE
ncbi:uncharacterized protein LOC128664189 [Bombina bombina]|uniref:uncharacterized protein LOC128664189 n=1 Tax=Bombina bombina TaxID=8345 RepID=UPI00235A8D86|nr:uncharacterized protein LOC128664189 [Bombina bombina]